MPSIPKLLAQALGNQKDLGFGPLTLTKVTAGTRTPGSLAGGTNPTSTDYPCKGFEETKRSGYQPDSSARASFLTISILGATLPAGVVPMAGDRITSKGVMYTIGSDGVQRDPVGAMYVCAVRAPGG